MERRRLPLARALLLAVLGLLALAATKPAAAGDEYHRVLDQPCIACHTEGGVSADLNARGRAFAAVADYKADPKAAWSTAVQAVPLQPSTDSGASVLVPIVVLVLLIAWGYMMIRRRRLKT